MGFFKSDVKKHITATSVTMDREDTLSNTVCKLNPELASVGFTV